MSQYVQDPKERSALTEQIEDLVSRAEFLNFGEIGLETQWLAREKGSVKWDDEILIERLSVKILPMLRELQAMETLLEAQIDESLKILKVQKQKYIDCGQGHEKNQLRVDYYVNHDWLIKQLEQLQACKKYLYACSLTCDKAHQVITTLISGKSEKDFPEKLRPYIEQQWLKRKNNEIYAIGGIKKKFRDVDGFIRHDMDVDDVLTFLKEFAIEFKHGKLEHRSGSL